MAKKVSLSFSHKRINRDALAKRRKAGIGRYNKGWSQYRIAKNMGVSFEAVSNWVEAYKDKGMRGLNSLGKPGPKIQKRKNKKAIKPKRVLRRLFNLFKK